MQNLFLLFFLFYFSQHLTLQHEISPEPVLAQLSGGLVQGYSQSHKGKTVNIFKGIPYAEPPEDGRRFQNPQSKNGWDSSWDSTNYESPCPGRSGHSRSHFGSEDCLYFNVFAHSNCVKESCPVVIYVYDGMNKVNESDILDLVIEDLVFVTFDFRRNVFGFLEIEGASYNVGLKDVKMALEVISEDISKMGGSNRDITVMGNGLGAEIIVYLLAGPQITIPSISKVIIQNPRPPMSAAQIRTISRKMVEFVGCGKNRISPQLLTEAAFRVMSSQEWSQLGPDTKQLFPNSTIIWKQPVTLWILESENPPIVKDIFSSCEHLTSLLGYGNPYTTRACVDRYNNTRQLQTDVSQIISFKLAELNNQRKGTSYLEDIQGARNSFGRILKTNKAFILAFVRNGKPAKELRPFTLQIPSVYAVNMATKTAENKLFDKSTVDFWFTTLLEIERKKKKTTVTTEAPTSTTCCHHVDVRGQRTNLMFMTGVLVALTIILCVAVIVMIWSRAKMEQQRKRTLLMYRSMTSERNESTPLLSGVSSLSSLNQQTESVM